MEAVVLAGGLGTRLGDLTRETPKPMVPVRNRPFLEYLLEYWKEQGVREFVLSVGYRHEVIERYFGAEFKGCPVRYSLETEPLGTGGGLLQSLDQVRGKDFLVLNGDTFFAVPLTAFRNFYLQKNAQAAMALFEVPARDRYEGVELGAEDQIRDFIPRGDSRTCRYANGGVYLISRTLLAGWKRGERKSLEKDFWPEWIRTAKAVYGFPAEQTFIDIGTPEDYTRAEQVLNTFIKPRGKEQS